MKLREMGREGEREREREGITKKKVTEKLFGKKEIHALNLERKFNYINLKISFGANFYFFFDCLYSNSFFSDSIFRVQPEVGRKCSPNIFRHVGM